MEEGGGAQGRRGGRCLSLAHAPFSALLRARGVKRELERLLLLSPVLSVRPRRPSVLSVNLSETEAAAGPKVRATPCPGAKLEADLNT